MVALSAGRILLLAAVLPTPGSAEPRQPTPDGLSVGPTTAEASRSPDPGQDFARHPATLPAELGSPVRLRAALSHGFYGRSEPDRLVAQVDLLGYADAPPERLPLNLALVIDSSGSMAENEKFMHASQAARLVVENLTERDVVSLIVFNERATVLSPAGRAVNKEFLMRRLAEVGPQGWTNLSAGLLEGFAQISSQETEGRINQVILLTDGLANRGVTDPGGLRKLAEAAYQRGTRLSTLGCGSQFDEKLLAALAEAGGGRYTFVRSSEQLPGAMAAELGGLLEVVAQNVRVEVKASGATVISRVYGRLIERPVASYSFNLGDMRQGERSMLMLDITPERRDLGATAGALIRLTADDPKSGTRLAREIAMEAAYAADAGQVEGSRNETVTLCAGVRDALEKSEEALLGLDAERFHKTAELFDRLYERARRHALETRDQELLNQAFLLKHFMGQLSAAREAGLLHTHSEARARLKDIHYRRYLLEHHRDRP
ncbi:MAG: hypothetical protein AMXMBFR13_39120 [Phycisphaerae bacterium]